MSNTAPIFIGGFLRSGTTLLRYMLDSHRNIACGPETEVFIHDLRQGIEQMFDSKRYDEYMRSYSLNESDIYDIFGATVYKEFFSRYLKTRNKPRWADKSPANCLNFDFLAKCFPDAFFIHVIRDGRDCICSLNSVKWHPNILKSRRAFKTAANDWASWVSKGRKDGKMLKQYLEVKYEDLVSSPRQTSEVILDFVKEPFDESVLEHHKSKFAFERSLDDKNIAGASTPVNTKSVGKFKEQLSPRQIKRFESMNKDLLKELGYETIYY